MSGTEGKARRGGVSDTLVRSRLGALVCAVVVAASIGCHAKARCEPGSVTPIALRVRADARSNPSSQGNPLTTEVRVYQLAGSRALEESSYDELLNGAEARLGEALVAASVPVEYLYPGAELAVTIERDAKAKFVAVLAFVREPIGRSWRVITPLPANDVCQDGKPVASRLEYELRGARLSGGLVAAAPGGERSRSKQRRR